MERKLAENIVSKYHAYSILFNEITELSFEVGEKEIAKVIRQGAAEAHSALFEKLVLTVGKEYPDLIPRDDVSTYLSP